MNGRCESVPGGVDAGGRPLGPAFLLAGFVQCGAEAGGLLLCGPTEPGLPESCPCKSTVSWCVELDMGEGGAVGPSGMWGLRRKWQ